MKMSKLSKMLVSFIGVPLAVASMLLLSTANADTVAVAKIDGVAVTGFNRLLSAPIWNVEVAPGVLVPAGFSFIFGYDPGEPEPLDLTPATPGDQILATGFDPAFAALFPGSFVEDPAMLNVPIHENYVVVAPFGIDFANRAQVPSVLDGPPNSVTRSLPNEPVTLDQWLSAEGILHINCHSDGSALVRIKMKNLIQNGIYTLWGVFPTGPFPLGGVPNAFIADKNGKAYIERIIGFCPITDLDPLLWTINITLHSDGNVYAGIPEVPFAGLPGGIVDHDHLNWPVNVHPFP